jgi:hypothetical protein
MPRIHSQHTVSACRIHRRYDLLIVYCVLVILKEIGLCFERLWQTSGAKVTASILRLILFETKPFECLDQLFRRVV